MERQEVSALATSGGRQRLQERSDEGAGAHCVEAFRRCFGTVILSEPCGLPALCSRAFTGAYAAAPAARQFRDAFDIGARGASWSRN
jgi:hypothetical protein